ncbi:glycosyltransferase family 2 protein [Criblamydia sequanensis]|uniref:Undecaprenyl-phosphate 4-deoxy-4-formamido-L-arabinose transferase n=1 Tax=Candidatus Criblamydia sequanensis CRIB-18 TaxID=1437425 RepID=A0A090CZ50_9BACT|nr:glycosyltransferase family 2 protein [Criblamydia sequanensis]CDR34172.1 Putative undecaprenyl-phosphate 4-deoxy-4-formamido-L-arabinose transferase [Criblamydia sequanensis CRIB-18]
MKIKYSLVIPLKNEEGNIEKLIEEIEAVMPALNEPFEVICIDDGSTDSTLQILKNLVLSKKFLKVLVFSNNFGQSSAFDAGFKAAQGQIVITLDGDRQNDPKDIPKLIEAINSGFDLVLGVRQKRKDTFSKRWISKIANKVRSFVCKDGVSDTGCSLKAYRKEALNKIKLFHGMHRFLPALFLMEGLKIKEIKVSHRERASGKTKYHFFNRSLNTVYDMLAVRWMLKRTLVYKIEKELP